MMGISNARCFQTRAESSWETARVGFVEGHLSQVTYVGFRGGHCGAFFGSLESRWIREQPCLKIWLQEDLISLGHSTKEIAFSISYPIVGRKVVGQIKDARTICTKCLMIDIVVWTTRIFTKDTTSIDIRMSTVPSFLGFSVGNFLIGSFGKCPSGHSPSRLLSSRLIANPLPRHLE